MFLLRLSASGAFQFTQNNNNNNNNNNKNNKNKNNKNNNNNNKNNKKNNKKKKSKKKKKNKNKKLKREKNKTKENKLKEKLTLGNLTNISVPVPPSCVTKHARFAITGPLVHDGLSVFATWLPFSPFANSQRSFTHPGPIPGFFC